MKYSPEKQCIVNDDGSRIKPSEWRNVGDTVSCSLVARFPLGCDEGRVGQCSHTPSSRIYGECETSNGKYECYQAYKRGERWRKYLRQELSH